MAISPFAIARLPRILFGAGRLDEVPKLAAGYGRRALMVTGGESFRVSPNWKRLCDGLKAADVERHDLQVTGEPSPQLVDAAVREYAAREIDVVIGVGGGSVLDAAKAVAGLLRLDNSVMDFLEGVGPELPYPGPAIPFIAVPTTAGTGSEATKNAVLSVQGEAGFKKSFRHETLVPEYAVVDPDLLATCTPAQIAANGMDALTQLMESFVSTNANPFTDALALSGIQAVKRGLFEAFVGGNTEAARNGRADMAYAALLSGITLAQTGLGSVHGLASPLGAFFPIPHGVACGTLLAAATELNIRALSQREPDNPALAKYERLGRALTNTDDGARQAALESLVAHLAQWTQRLNMPKLGEYGIGEADVDKLVAHSRGSSMRTNPIVLSDAEIGELVRGRL